MQAAPRLLGCLIFAFVASTGAAEAREWLAESVRGTVLKIVDGRWTEFDEASILENEALRTLQSGRLQLESNGSRINVGPNAAIELFTKPDDSTTLIRQYGGIVTVAAGSGNTGLVRLEAEDLQVVIAGGSTVSVSMANNRAVVTVEAGNAEVTDKATGKKLAVAEGQAVDTASGDIAVAAATGGAASGNNGNGNGGTNPNAGAGNNNAGGNGNGNAGGNGNGNAGGNGNGNAGGSASGNENAGSGNNNAGGNGGSNGNAGGNGNGNAGGNGNGNGSGGG